MEGDGYKQEGIQFTPDVVWPRVQPRGYTRVLGASDQEDVVEDDQTQVGDGEQHEGVAGAGGVDGEEDAIHHLLNVPAHVTVVAQEGGQPGQQVQEAPGTEGHQHWHPVAGEQGQGGVLQPPGHGQVPHVHGAVAQHGHQAADQDPRTGVVGHDGDVLDHGLVPHQVRHLQHVEGLHQRNCGWQQPGQLLCVGQLAILDLAVPGVTVA